MSKVEKRIGFLYPASYADEVTILHTMTYTSDGRFRPECMETVPMMGIPILVEHLQHKQRGELSYNLFIVDTWGSGGGIVDAMEAQDLPVLSMQDMFLAIYSKIDCDTINATPNIYTPEPKGKIPGSYRTSLYDKSALLPISQDRPKCKVSMSLKSENVDVEVL